MRVYDERTKRGTPLVTPLWAFGLELMLGLKSGPESVSLGVGDYEQGTYYNYVLGPRVGLVTWTCDLGLGRAYSLLGLVGTNEF